MNTNLAEFELSCGLTSQLPTPQGCELVFSGRSNVGKSSMLNKLLNRKALARVSSMPGKTATINFYRIENVRFVDLPGYGYAKVAKGEQRRYSDLISGYFNHDRPVVLVFLLMDMRHKPTADDVAMVDFLIDSELPFVVVLTKSDKLNKTQYAQRLEAYPEELGCDSSLMLLPFSSETGAGIEQLRAVIDDVTAEENV